MNHNLDLEFSRNLKHSRVNPVPKLEEEEILIKNSENIRNELHYHKFSE